MAFDNYEETLRRANIVVAKTPPWKDKKTETMDSLRRDCATYKARLEKVVKFYQHEFRCECEDWHTSCGYCAAHNHAIAIAEGKE